MGEENLAEDMVQESFIKVYNSIEQYAGDAEISTWVYRIAANTCLGELRKRQTKKQSPNIGSMARTQEEEEHWKDSLHDGSYVDDKILKNENTKALYQAIQKLSDDQQKAFVMYYLDEKSIKEVAEVMQKSEGAIEALLHRARGKMKELLYEHYKNYKS